MYNTGMSERIDDLQYKGLKLIQDTDLFCFGTDAVLLASFCEVKSRDTIVDLGTGTGIIPVLLSGRNDSAKLIGLELQPAAAGIAKRNAELNGLTDRFRVICGNIKEAKSLINSRVTAVVCNPPYEKVGSGGVSLSDAVRIARHEVECTLADVADAAASLLDTAGRFYMIHRAARTAEIIFELKSRRLEPKRMRFIQSRAGAEPGYVLIKAVKDASPGIEVAPPLIIYDENGETEEVKQIYHRK